MLFGGPGGCGGRGGGFGTGNGRKRLRDIIVGKTNKNTVLEKTANYIRNNYITDYTQSIKALYISVYFPIYSYLLYIFQYLLYNRFPP